MNIPTEQIGTQLSSEIFRKLLSENKNYHIVSYYYPLHRLFIRKQTKKSPLLLTEESAIKEFSSFHSGRPRLKNKSCRTLSFPLSNNIQPQSASTRTREIAITRNLQPILHRGPRQSIANHFVSPYRTFVQESTRLRIAPSRYLGHGYVIELNSNAGITKVGGE